MLQSKLYHTINHSLSHEQYIQYCFVLFSNTISCHLLFIVEKYEVSTQEDGVETSPVNSVHSPEIPYSVKEEVETETTEVDTTIIKEEIEIKTEQDQVWLLTQNESSTDYPPASTTACSDSDSESKSETESESEDSEPVSTQTKPVHRRRLWKHTTDVEPPVQESVARYTT